MSCKRKFDNLKDIQEEVSNTELHFGIEILSPVKKSKSGYDYFNGQVNDGTKALRLVGFNTESRDELAKFVDQRTPIKATNCAVKKSRIADEFEIHVNKGTTFNASPRKLQFNYAEPHNAVDVQISEVASMDNGTLVNVKAQVSKVVPGRTVSTGILQTVTLKDETGMIDLTLWNKNVDKLFESATYNFIRLTINTFQNNKVLNFTYQSSFVKSEDSMNTCTSITTQNMDTITAYLVGIQDYRVHFWCLYCDSKLDEINNDFTHCTKCHLLQLITSCKFQVTSRLLFQTCPGNSEDTKFYLLNASTQIFLKLLEITAMAKTTITASQCDKVILKSAQNQPIGVTHDGCIVTNVTQIC